MIYEAHVCRNYACVVVIEDMKCVDMAGRRLLYNHVQKRSLHVTIEEKRPFDPLKCSPISSLSNLELSQLLHDSGPIGGNA